MTIIDRIYPHSNFYLLLFVLGIFTSCNGQNKPNPSKQNIKNTQEPNPPTSSGIMTDFALQIGEYVVKIFEDKKGNLWFGTMAKGVARYDGESLTYFSMEDGLCGNTVTSIIEDKEGNIWLGTHSGLAKFDGKMFTNFTEKEGLCDDRVSNIMIDSKDNFWVGTWGGVCLFDGSVFSDFTLPNPDVEIPTYQETANWVTEIIEDKQGDIWFGRSGYGACKYDGVSFTNFTKKEGLASNCVQAIQEDSKGNIWFGSRVAEKDHFDVNKRMGDGGLNKYDGNAFIDFPELEGLNKNDIYNIFEDKKGNLWIGANGVGLYRYDGGDFTLYNETDRLDLIKNFGIQGILEDKNGKIWIGCSGGLFRLKDSSLVNVTVNGPF